MMAAATRSGNYTFMHHWFLTRDKDGTIHDANEEQPEDTERTLRVDFDFSAEEAIVMCDKDGGGYPGSPAEVAITKVEAWFAEERKWVEVPMELVAEIMDEDLTEQAWQFIAEKGEDGR